MNEFTKEELKELLYALDCCHSAPVGVDAPPLMLKLQSMIDNYCEHEMNKKLHEIKHSYYCSDTNYFSNECTWEYSSWDEFYEYHKDDNINMDLIFRWDWDKDEDGDGEPTNTLQLSVIRQCKGVFGAYLIPVSIDDEERIKKFLIPYAQYMKHLWQGIE